MKKFILVLMILIPASAIAQQMNIISFNIRYNTKNDGINAWPNRIDMVSGLLKFHDADIFGLQEALYEQIKDLEKQFPDFEWFGVGRDDGDKEGEFVPIFFNPEKFILLKKGHFWLSENCEAPGLGWDAACNRTTTWGKFQSKVTGKKFLVLNTHFDHRGKEARNNSATLLINKIKEIDNGSNLPVILTGDFNLTPETEPIGRIKNILNDSREVTVAKPYGPIGTTTSFDWNAPMKKRIDYIFINDEVKVLKYAVLTDAKEQRFPSDHLPVFAKIQLK